MRGLIALSLAAYAVAAPTVSHGTIHGDAAPILSSSNAEVVPNSYLIKFKNHVSEASAQHHQSWIQQIHTSNEHERMELRKRGQIPFADDVFRGLKHTYQIGEHFMGYSGHFDESVIEQVRRHPDVSCLFLPSCLIRLPFRVPLLAPVWRSHGTLPWVNVPESGMIMLSNLIMWWRFRCAPRGAGYSVPIPIALVKC